MGLSLPRQRGVRGGRSSYLLDNHPGAAAAYSLRYLRSGYVGQPVVRVRRSSDNTEQDFTPPEVTDGALASFCGAEDGFVTTWYEQSPNARDATQTIEADQPQIVSNGSLITDTGNGRVALDIEGSSVALTNFTNLGDSSSEWTLSVVAANNIGDRGDVFDSRAGLRLIPSLDGSGAYYLDSSWRGAALSLTSTDHKVGYQFKANGSDVWVNGSNVQSGVSYETTQIELNPIGESTSRIQELLLWEDTIDVGAVQNNQESYY